ncbi:hypothetical protein CH302_01890 [Rhodococcus sp. 15-2388-1-1a]|nr:hypothetical protein CH302_01890 [Rhodococcus sp. 15-2388-1-1a]
MPNSDAIRHSTRLERASGVIAPVLSDVSSSIVAVNSGGRSSELGTDGLLGLVRRALNEIDDQSVDVTARRVSRLASLLGESELSVYLGLELSPLGGLPATNAENIRNLMVAPEEWGLKQGAHETAHDRYIGNRQIQEGLSTGKVLAVGLNELDNLIARLNGADRNADESQHLQFARGVKERVRHTLFSNLCRMERQLAFADVNEQIFERFRSRVDSILAQRAPDVIAQFSAVHRRLKEAASADPNGRSSDEDLAQAAVTCRRILKSVADHLLPGTAGARSDSGQSLGDEAYRNRMFEYIKQEVSSGSVSDALKATVDTAYTRFVALDQLANKGLHATIGLYEAELCAIHTYVVAGELLALKLDAA